MTAVIGFQYKQQPVMFGDLLLTDISNSQDPNVLLPTVSDIRVAKRQNGSPAGLAQKIAIISGDLVIAWSGQLSVGRDVLCELRTRYSDQKPSEKELVSLFDTYHAKYGKGLSLLGMLKVNETLTYQCSLNGWMFEDPRFGIVRAAGSGAQPLMDMLQTIEGYENKSDRLLNPLEATLGVSLSMMGYLQGREVVTAQNFDHYYGGGYEIATPINGRWQKIDDFMSIYWWGEELQNGSIRLEPMPIRIIRSQYTDDILAVRSLSFPKNNPEDRCFKVAPEYRVPSTHELASVSVPSFDARWICHQFVIKKQDGSLRPINSVTFNQDPTHAKVRVLWDGTNFEAILAPGYFEQLHGLLVGRYKANRPQRE